MTEFRITVHIDRDIDIVVKAFLEPGNIVHYTKDLVRFEVVKREPGLVGSVARLHYSQGGHPYVLEDRMLSVEPGKRYVSQVTGDALEALVETTFERSGEGTEMTVSWSGKAKVLSLRLLFPLLRGKMARGAREELETFKDLVETRGADFSGPHVNGAEAQRK